MGEAREIIDAAVVDRYLQVAAVVLPAVGVLVVAVGALARRRLAHFAAGIGLVVAGPLVFGMWRLYCYLVRYDPRSGYFGLEKVKVLLLSVLIFAAVGGLLGVAAAQLTSRTKHRKA